MHLSHGSPTSGSQTPAYNITVVQCVAQAKWQSLSGDWARSPALRLKRFLWLAILQFPLLGICSWLLSFLPHVHLVSLLLYHLFLRLHHFWLSSTHCLRSSSHCRTALSFFSIHMSCSVRCMVSSLLGSNSASRSTMATWSSLLSLSRLFSISSWLFSQTMSPTLSTGAQESFVLVHLLASQWCQGSWYWIPDKSPSVVIYVN